LIGLPEAPGERRNHSGRVVVRAAALSVRARPLASFDNLDQRDREFTEYLRPLIQWLDGYIAERK
jgi:hypothetical protein